MSGIRKAYLEAAESATGLLASPEVVAAWIGPSAPAEFSVSGLCGHLANQVFSVTEGRVSGEGLVDQPRVPLLEHYFRSDWIDAPLDAEINVLVRDSGARAAGTGPADLVRRLREHLAVLQALLPAQPADLLARLSLHKHGQAAMLRALTRSERAPADITAF